MQRFAREQSDRWHLLPGSGSNAVVNRASLADWSRDGRWLLYTVLDPETGRDVWALPLEGDRQPRAILQSRFTESTPTLSADGRWLAYLSNESGNFEVYATSFPEPGRTVQISVDVVGDRQNIPGGVDPLWLPQGDRIVYLSFAGESRTLFEVDITTEPELRAGRPRPIRDVFYSDYIGRNYDVTPDGKRFVMVVGGPSSQAETIHVVVNWFEVLKERVPVE